MRERKLAARCLFVLTLVILGGAMSVAAKPPMQREPTCGEELAQAAEVPELLGKLFTHVASNLETHAEWVGTSTPAARAEREAMLRVAADYKGIGKAANDAVVHMRAMKTLAAAPHDPSKLDRKAFAQWMKQKIELQRALAAMLLAHAEESEKALAQE